MSAVDFIDYTERLSDSAVERDLVLVADNEEYAGSWRQTVEGLGDLARDCVIDGAAILLEAGRRQVNYAESSYRQTRFLLGLTLGFIHFSPVDDIV